MRLARLAAVGLAAGVLTGFAVALLRSRPRTPLAGVIPLRPGSHRPVDHDAADHDAAVHGGAAEGGAVDRAVAPPAAGTERVAHEATVLAMPTHRRVTG
jgi:hypothetical protein